VSGAEVTPDQAVLDGLLADARGVAEAISDYLGGRLVSVSIGVNDVPAGRYHALPHEPIKALDSRADGTRYSWKQVAQTHLGRIDVMCVEHERCPDQAADAAAPDLELMEYGAGFAYLRPEGKGAA
jgi:hypothetical protein